MGWISVNDLANNRGTRQSFPEEDITFGQNRNALRRAGAKVRWAIVVRVSQRLMRELRWQEGDKIELLFDPDDRAGLLRRVPKGKGYKLQKGGQVQITWAPGMPSIAETTPCDSVSVTSEGILFTFPESVSFTENVRAREGLRMLERGTPA